MALLGLPLELLQRIIKETIPESIENVAVTCTSLHNASKIYLGEHNRLRKRYKHFSYSKYTVLSQRGYVKVSVIFSSRCSPVDRRPRHTWKGHWDPVTQETGIELQGATELITEIVRNPVIPRYIETADLKGNVGMTDAPDDLVDEHPALHPIFPRIKDGDIIDRVRNLLNDSPYLAEAGVDSEAWLSGMLDDTSGHAEVLLLTLLTNVRELALPQSWDHIPGRNSGHLRYGEETPRSDRKTIWPVLDALVRRANDPTISEAGLSKLEVYRPFTGTGYECRNEMTVNTPFLAIKSVRQAYIGGCIALDDGYTGMPFDPEYPEYSPRLERLDLVGCTFGPEEMRELLLRLPNLKRLHFAYETKWHGCGHNLDAGAMMNAIMECAGETLEELSMWMMVHYGTAGRTLVDMNGFKQLKSLHIDGLILMGPEFDKANEEYEIADAADVCPLDEMAAPRALDLLPPSLEKFQNEPVGDRSRDSSDQLKKCLAALFDGFEEGRGERLPNLQEIVVEVVQDDMNQEMKEQLEGKGAQVVLSPAKADPDFVTDFYRRMKAVSCVQVFAGLVLLGTCQAAGQDRSNDFFDPPAVQRPRLRYWLPDGTVDPEKVKSDIQSAGKIGAGGVEFLPFYNYGGQLGPPPVGANWSTSGFGTPDFIKTLIAGLEAHKESGLSMDFAIGPNRPGHPSNEGLQWDLFAETQAVAADGQFNGTIPGWGTGQLVSAVSAIVTSRTNVTINTTSIIGTAEIWWEELVLQNGSLNDITSMISPTGELSINLSNSSSNASDYELFFFYETLSGHKNLAFASNRTETIWDNGSYVVDHFSSKGAEVVRDFWEQYIFVDNVKELLTEVGNYGKSHLITSHYDAGRIVWKFSLTHRGQGHFPRDSRSSLATTCAPTSLSSYSTTINLQNDAPGHTRCFLDTYDKGQGYINDYRAALADGYQEYVTTLANWTHSLGLGLSAQVSYNLPMDMEASIPFVDTPECESLQFHDNLDGYRQFSGPANLARQTVISNELGAVFGSAYRFTISDLLLAMNRAVAGGVNQFVIHGQSYSGNYPQTTWPGYTAFRYYVSDLYSPKRPDWDHGLQAGLDHMGRVQHIQQTGVTRTDVAFYNKQTATDPNMGTLYTSDDLILKGWSYNYLSPDNFALPQAYVGDNLLAPQNARYQALVVLGSQNLTSSGLLKLTEFAEAGLPIIIAGGSPGEYPTENKASNVSFSFDTSLQQLLNISSVYQVAEGEIAEKLEGLGLKPRVGVKTNGTWHTTWRQDSSGNISYAYVFSDAEYSNGELIVQSGGIPYFFDAWTGAREPVLYYTTEGSTTTIPLTLAGNQTKIIGFAISCLGDVVTPEFHFKKLSGNVLGYRADDQGIVVHAVASADPTTLTLSTGVNFCYSTNAASSFELPS
ncbi:secreted protein [Colletotrichum asianum]